MLMFCSKIYRTNDLGPPGASPVSSSLTGPIFKTVSACVLALLHRTCYRKTNHMRRIPSQGEGSNSGRASVPEAAKTPEQTRVILRDPFAEPSNANSLASMQCSSASSTRKTPLRNLCAPWTRKPPGVNSCASAKPEVCEKQTSLDMSNNSTV